MADLPWAAIGRVQIPGGPRCTAFLIQPTLAVTSAHCVYVSRLEHVAPAESIHFLLGYDSGRYASHSIPTQIILAPGWAPDSRNGYDLALLRFATPVAPPERVLAIAPSSLRAGTPVMLGGYGQDRTERMVADENCAAQGYAPAPGQRAMLLHNCTGTSGTSGAPLLVRVGPVWDVAGVQTTARIGQPGGTAVPGFALQALLQQAGP